MKTTKLLFSIVLIALLHVFVQAREEVVVMGLLPNGTTTNLNYTVEIPEGEEIKIDYTVFGREWGESWYGGYGPTYVTNNLVPNMIQMTYIKNGFTVYKGGINPPFPRMFGPGTISFSLASSRYVQPFSYQLMPDTGIQLVFTYAPAYYAPNRSIIIPAGSKGGTITLESSYDLLSWAPAMPGTFSQPTNNLFFRLRLERLDP